MQDLSGEEKPAGRLADEVPAAFHKLATRINALMREDELLHLFAGTIRDLFPGSLVCLRLLEPRGPGLSLVYATGRLHPELRDALKVVRREPGPADLLENRGIELVDAYCPIFQGASCGIDGVLYDDADVLGIVNVEWIAPRPEDSTGRSVVLALSGLFAMAIRDSRLVAESVHLREYLAKLVDQANAPIVVMGPDRRIRMYNRCVERLTGYSRAAVVGRDVMTLLPGDERQRVAPAIQNAVAGRPAPTLEIRIPRADGRGLARIAFNVTSILAADGETVDAVIAVGQDLTEIRRLQQQVIHAEKLATIGQLAAGVVHEINNPLTSISVYADYLRKLMEGEKRSQQDLTYVGRIREAADRILRFTQDLMSFARPAGEEPELLDLKDVVESAAAFCEHVVARAGARVEKSLGRAPRIYGIRGQLQQVFINLVTNACHAMTEVDRDRVLGLVLADNGDGRVRVEVSDRGTGIPQEVVDKMFEPFFTTKAVGAGTGLGLSIVRNIIESHQAEIRVDTQVGRGTTFSILFYAA